MFCCTLLYVHSSIAIILMGKRELIALLNLSSWCLVMVEQLFLAVPRSCLQFVIVVFPDHTHLLFLEQLGYYVRRYYLRRLSATPNVIAPKVINKVYYIWRCIAFEVAIEPFSVDAQADLRLCCLQIRPAPVRKSLQRNCEQNHISV